MKHPTLGSRLLRAEPEQPAEELTAADVALGHIKKTLEKQELGDPDSAARLRAALDGVERLARVPDEDESTQETNIIAVPRKPNASRDALAAHFNWIDANLSKEDRPGAFLHALATHVDGLDPIDDANTIQAAHRMFAAANPETQDET